MARYGYALQHAASDLRADKEVVLVAVRKHGCALQFAAAEIRAEIRAVNSGGQFGRTQRWCSLLQQITATLTATR